MIKRRAGGPPAAGPSSHFPSARPRPPHDPVIHPRALPVNKCRRPPSRPWWNSVYGAGSSGNGMVRRKITLYFHKETKQRWNGRNNIDSNIPKINQGTLAKLIKGKCVLHWYLPDSRCHISHLQVRVAPTGLLPQHNMKYTIWHINLEKILSGVQQFLQSITINYNYKFVVVKIWTQSNNFAEFSSPLEVLHLSE